MKIYLIGQYQFDETGTSYRCFYKEADAKSCARELIEESEDDDEEAIEVTWNDFLDRWDCRVCCMEVLKVE